MPMSHGINKKAPTIISHQPPPPPPPPLFVVLQEIFYESNLALLRLLQKIMHFQSKTNFLIQLIAGQF